MNDTQTAFFRRNLPEFLFWGLAAVLLFLNLDFREITGSEGRWVEVVREMFLSGDFLHPNINGQPYFDKPLISYWIIAFFSLQNGCAVNLFLIRIPSALAALAVLWFTRVIAEKTVGRHFAKAAGWIMLTVYSLAFWGRLGEADMLNMAFSTGAVAWYLCKRDRSDFVSYLVFGLICAVGGQTKGLSSIAVPVIVVLIDVILAKRWKQHLNWSLAAAGLLSLLVYLLPFVAAMLQSGDYSANGLNLVFRENILRFFKAFDHKQPWYAYFIHLPQLLLPWTPFFILAIVHSLAQWKKNVPGERFLLISIAAIFFVFSASDSKRVYYILPVLPYCAVLTAACLLAEGNSFLLKLRDFLLKCCSWILFLSGVVVLLGTPALLFTRQYILSKKLLMFPDIFVYWSAGTLFAAALLLILIFLLRRRNGDLVNIAVSLAVILISVFGSVLPAADTLRTQRRFFADAVHKLKAAGINSRDVMYFRKNHIDPTFYLGLKHPIPVLDSEEVPGTVPGKGICAVIRQKKTAAILMQYRQLKMIPDPKDRQYLTEHIFAAEPLMPWESRKKSEKKYIFVVIP